MMKKTECDTRRFEQVAQIDEERQSECTMRSLKRAAWPDEVKQAECTTLRLKQGHLGLSYLQSWYELRATTLLRYVAR